MLYFLLILVLLLGLLLWLPFQVEIDTERNVYLAKWTGIFGIRAVPGEQRWHWFFQVFFWETEWQPGKKKAKPKPPKKPAAKKKKPPFTLRQGWSLMKNLWRAIELTPPGQLGHRRLCPQCLPVPSLPLVEPGKAEFANQLFWETRADYPPANTPVPIGGGVFAGIFSFKIIKP